MQLEQLPCVCMTCITISPCCHPHNFASAQLQLPNLRYFRPHKVMRQSLMARLRLGLYCWQRLSDSYHL